MPKLKYSDLPPFRWYPVEEVEIESGEDVLCASENGGIQLEFLGMSDGGCFYDQGVVCDVRFVMRLLTPEEMKPKSGWFMWNMADPVGTIKRFEDCTPEEFEQLAKDEKRREEARNAN